MIGNFSVFTFYNGPVISVEIETDGLYARGSARLHPEDDYDHSRGFNLAYARAVERLGAKLRKRAMKVING